VCVSHIGMGVYKIWGIRSFKIIDRWVWRYIRNDYNRGLVQILSSIKIKIKIKIGIKYGLTQINISRCSFVNLCNIFKMV
jgi:hypothetical protein